MLLDTDLVLPPTQDELPCDDGVPMETQRHKWQMDLLIDGLSTWLDAREDGYVNGNMFIYFSLSQVKHQDFKGPDFFAALGVPKGERKSWVVWEEDGKYPDLIIELLSNSTANVDRILKRELYANRFHTPEYFYFSPETLEFAGFRLVMNHYEPILPNEQGWLWSEVMGLFLGVYEQELRYFTIEGTLLPTPQEAVQIEVERGLAMVDQERLKVEQARQEAEQQRLQTEQARQEAEQERLKAIQAEQEAEQERLKAIQAEQEAEQERLKAIQAEQEANQAKAELQRLQEKIDSLGVSLD